MRFHPILPSLVLGLIVALPAVAAAGSPRLLATISLPSGPTGLAVSNGAVYAPDYHTVLELDAALTSVRAWDTSGILCSPTKVAVLGDWVYVTDISNPASCPDAVYTFSTGGNFDESWCSKLAPTCGIGRIAAGPSRELYAADSNTSMIRVYSAEGFPVRSWGGVGSGPGQFGGTMADLAVDQHGHVFVIDDFNHRIQKFDSRGTWLGEWSGTGTYGPVWRPSCIAADRGGHVYVCNSDVQVYDEEGNFLVSWEPPHDAHLVAVDEAGFIYVAGEQKISRYSNPFNEFALDLPVQEPAILLHIGEVAGQSPCTSAPAHQDNVRTFVDLPEGAPGSYYVYVLASPRTSESADPGITGLQARIEYESAPETPRGVTVHSWIRCAVLDFPGSSWPAAGSANTITWDLGSCQRRELAVAGYFYLTAYSAATMRITPAPMTGLAKVADCGGAERTVPVDRFGWVAFRAQEEDPLGCNPVLQSCGTVAVKTTSWGRIKTRH